MERAPHGSRGKLEERVFDVLLAHLTADNTIPRYVIRLLSERLRVPEVLRADEILALIREGLEHNAED